MALTDAQKAKVRRYLGYPDVNREPNSELEGALTELSADGEVEVLLCLDSLATIDGVLTASWARQMVKRAEEVELYGADEIHAMRSEGGRLVTTLASILGVEPMLDVFGGHSTTGLMLNG